MSRAQFNKQVALENAVAVFWQQGFHGTSMSEIIEATKLKPGSIYLAFGNKEGLYQACLEHYYQQNLARIKDTLESAASVGAGICLILKSMINESINKDYCSCFLIKSQLEINDEHPELNAYISQHLENAEQLYTTYLEQEYDKKTAQTYATSLMLHIFGVRVYGYQLKNTHALTQSVQQGLPWLPWETTLQ